MRKPWWILVVDDEPIQRDSLAAWLTEDGYRVNTAPSGRDAIAQSREHDYAIYFIDLKMPPGIDGIETMMEIQKLRPGAAVIIITAYATVDTAIAAMKEGAQEYIVKPCNPREVSLLVERIVRFKNLQRENVLLRRRLTKQYTFHDIISKNARMHAIFELIKDVADLRSTVLIHGESGTGKEMLARAIHQSGDRRAKPFVAVSCAALAESLLESELFGHERGSFTGAVGRQKGKFELADGGTIFLDEIGDISPKVQAELLRVLQERSFFRVGGGEEVKVDVRVIAATNTDLEAAVAEGRFRDDLFYRLNVINIEIPPLRERREDIPLLAAHLVERLALELNREIESISEGAIGVLMGQNWPGNVRELENAIERAIVTCKEHVLGEDDFAFLLAGHGNGHANGRGGNGHGWTVPPGVPLHELERMAIEATLARTQGNVTETARVLGIDRSTLYDKLKRYGIERMGTTQKTS